MSKAKPGKGLPRINIAGIEMFQIDSWETLERIFEEIGKPKKRLAAAKAKPKTKKKKA